MTERPYGLENIFASSKPSHYYQPYILPPIAIPTSHSTPAISPKYSPCLTPVEPSAFHQRSVSPTCTKSSISCLLNYDSKTAPSSPVPPLAGRTAISINSLINSSNDPTASDICLSASSNSANAFGASPLTSPYSISRPFLSGPTGPSPNLAQAGAMCTPDILNAQSVTSNNSQMRTPVVGAQHIFDTLTANRPALPNTDQPAFYTPSQTTASSPLSISAILSPASSPTKRRRSDDDANQIVLPKRKKVAHNGNTVTSFPTIPSPIPAPSCPQASQSTPVSPKLAHAKDIKATSKLIASTLRTRLTYALVKVQNGWESQSLSRIESRNFSNPPKMASMSAKNPFSPSCTKPKRANSNSKQHGSPQHIHIWPVHKRSTSEPGMGRALDLPAPQTTPAKVYCSPASSPPFIPSASHSPDLRALLDSPESSPVCAKSSLAFR